MTCGVALMLVGEMILEAQPGFVAAEADGAVDLYLQNFENLLLDTSHVVYLQKRDVWRRLAFVAGVALLR